MTSYRVLIELISHTRTEQGLEVYAVLDERKYALKQQVSDAEMAALKLERHEFHGDWNYTIKPHDKPEL